MWPSKLPPMNLCSRPWINIDPSSIWSTSLVLPWIQVIYIIYVLSLRAGLHFKKKLQLIAFILHWNFTVPINSSSSLTSFKPSTPFMMSSGTRNQSKYQTKWQISLCKKKQKQKKQNKTKNKNKNKTNQSIFNSALALAKAKHKKGEMCHLWWCHALPSSLHFGSSAIVTFHYPSFLP